MVAVAKLKAAATLRVAANDEAASALLGLGLGDKFRDLLDADCAKGEEAALAVTQGIEGDCGRLLPDAMKAAGTGDAFTERAAVMDWAILCAA